MTNEPGVHHLLLMFTLTLNISNIIHIHHNEVNQCNLIINTEDGLKKIVRSVDTNYRVGLRNDNTGFASVLSKISIG